MLSSSGGMPASGRQQSDSNQAVKLPIQTEHEGGIWKPCMLHTERNFCASNKTKREHGQNLSRSVSLVRGREHTTQWPASALLVRARGDANLRGAEPLLSAPSCTRRLFLLARHRWRPHWVDWALLLQLPLSPPVVPRLCLTTSNAVAHGWRARMQHGTTSIAMLHVLWSKACQRLVGLTQRQSHPAMLLPRSSPWQERLRSTLTVRIGMLLSSERCSTCLTSPPASALQR